MTDPNPAHAPEPAAPRGFLASLRLVTLAAFALAQPLFGVLQENATFLTASRATTGDLWILAFAAALVPGILCALVVGAVGLVSKALAGGLRGLLVTLLVALIALPQLRALTDPVGAWTLLPALLVGAVGAYAERRWELLGSFLDILSPSPLVFALLFMFGPGVARATRTDTPATSEEGLVDAGASAVLIVFDELPIQSLMTPELEIDARLFPNFARLAAASTWFRNATASHENTERALPAILTGLDPDDPELLPTSSDHPKSLFRLLGGSYRMRVWESFTSVCPPELADRGTFAAQELSSAARRRALLRDSGIVLGHVLLPEGLAAELLPTIDGTWAGFGAAEEPAASTQEEGPELLGEFAEGLPGKQLAAHESRADTVREFIAAMDADPTPTLHFLHVLLPHGPYVHLPSSKRYDPQGLTSGFPGGRMPEWPPVSAQQHSRHLLQLAGVDRLLGELLDRMQETGLDQRAALVVVADHGVNFAPGQYARQVFKRNAREIAHVPFFVRLPGQESGRVDDRDVRTVDVLPTLLEAIEVQTDWAFDGLSALSESAPARGPKQVFRRDRKPLELSPALPSRWIGIERKLAQFGPNPEQVDLYRAAPAGELIGSPVDALVAGTEPNWRLRLDVPDAFDQIAEDASVQPCVCRGFVRSDDARPAPDVIVVALDGVVRATAACSGGRPGAGRFTALVPEEYLGPGAHELRLFTLRGDGRLLELQPEE